MEKDERFKQAEFGAIVGIVGNIILAIVKAVIGYIGNSKALLADAVHSASDVIGSLAVLFDCERQSDHLMKIIRMVMVKRNRFQRLLLRYYYLLWDLKSQFHL